MSNSKLWRFCTTLVLLSTLHLPSTLAIGDQQGGAAAIPGEQTIFACKGKALKLSCPKDNEVIKVTRANYGRFSIAVCNDQSMTTWSVNCFSPKAKHVLQSKCNNFGGCEILAEDYDFGPNLCPDTERYLEASYSCMKKETNANDRPPWANPNIKKESSGTSLNSARRKPPRRVPITAPPSTLTTTLSSLASSSSSASTTTPSTTTTTISSLTRSSTATTSSSITSSRIPLNNPRFNESRIHVISTPVFPEIQTCKSKEIRGLTFPETPAGKQSVQKCPRGHGSWRCNLSGRWWPEEDEFGASHRHSAGPDLSKCCSKNWSIFTNPIEVEAAMGNTIHLYGGDIEPLLELVAKLTEQFRSSTRSETDARSLTRILSNLLDERLDIIWKDLESQLLTSTVRRFMKVAEDLGMAIANVLAEKERNQKELEEGIAFVTTNIYFAIKALEDESNNVNNKGRKAVFPLRTSVSLPPRFSLFVNQNYYYNRSRLSTSTDHQPQDEKFQKRRTDSASSRVSIQLLNNQIMPALPKLQESQNFHQPPSSRDEENRRPRRHQVVFLSFLRLKQVKPRMKSTAEMMNLMGSNSVISVKINPPLPSENELQVILELPKYPQNEEIECLSWTQPKERWCHVAKWHNGSRECVCNGLSSYVLNLTATHNHSATGRDVLMDLKDEAAAIDGRGYSSHFGKEATSAEATMTSTMIVIVAVSATFLVISVLSAGLLVVYCRRVKIRDKKWEEEETRPWWYRKSSPSSTVTTASSQPQVDSTDLGSIQTASTSLLLGSGGGCNGARNLTSTMNLSQQSNANHQLPYHHFQPLMNESASSPSVASASTTTAASIISRPSSHHHYESHLYGTLAGQQSQRLSKSTDQKKATSSTWKRLLSTMRLRSNEAQHRERRGQNYGGSGRPNLTLLHHSGGGHGLNAENTLRLEAHRQLFQSHDLIRSGAGEVDPILQYLPQTSSHYGGGYDHHHRTTTRPFGGHHQLYATECQPQNVYKGNHWTSTAASESARLADGIYQVPLDIEDEPTPSVSRHVPRGCPNNTSRPQRPPKRRHRSSSSNNNRLSNTNTNDSESPVRGGIMLAEEDLWLLRGGGQKLLARSSETTSAAASRPSFRSQSEENFLVTQNNQHIYMEVPKRTSTTTAEEYDESDLSSAATASAGSNGRGYQQQQNPAMMSQC